MSADGAIIPDDEKVYDLPEPDHHHHHGTDHLHKSLRHTGPGFVTLAKLSSLDDTEKIAEPRRVFQAGADLAVEVAVDVVAVGPLIAEVPAASSVDVAVEVAVDVAAVYPLMIAEAPVVRRHLNLQETIGGEGQPTDDLECKVPDQSTSQITTLELLDELYVILELHVKGGERHASFCNMFTWDSPWLWHVVQAGGGTHQEMVDRYAAIEGDLQKGRARVEADAAEVIVIEVGGEIPKGVDLVHTSTDWGSVEEKIRGGGKGGN